MALGSTKPNILHDVMPEIAFTLICRCSVDLIPERQNMLHYALNKANHRDRIQLYTHRSSNIIRPKVPLS